MSALKNSLAYAISENVFGKPLVVRFVNQFINNENEENYNLAVESLNASLSLCNDFSKDLNLRSRILATTADGTTWYDSGKGDKNTYENFIKKAINENHASRYSIGEAMASQDGFGWETRLSTTTKNFETAYAVRGGLSPTQIQYVIRLTFF
jgi:hypothetical protein